MIKDGIIKVFQVFYSYVKFEKSLIATFMALIPKTARAMVVEDYRLISIVNRVYKIISSF